jgi:hypothetical protein
VLIEPFDETNRTLIRFYGQEIVLHSFFRISFLLLLTPYMQALSSVYNFAFSFISCPFSRFAFSNQQEWRSEERKLLKIAAAPPTHNQILNKLGDTKNCVDLK